MLSCGLRYVNLRREPAAMLKLKRIYEAPAAGDGYRILVDRLWPRGVSKGAARIDLWMKQIAPSDSLRKWFGHQPARWAGFRRRYHAELRGAPQLAGQLKRLLKGHGTVTLLFGARDERRNQAVALRDFLRGTK